MSKRSIDFGRSGNVFAFILLLAASMFWSSAATVSGSGPHFDTAELRQFTSGGHMRHPKLKPTHLTLPTRFQTL